MSTQSSLILNNYKMLRKRFPILNNEISRKTFESRNDKTAGKVKLLNLLINNNSNG